MINPIEILRRRDMREVFTFTIDPADAKDFDDALSFERLEETGDGGPVYQIGVHIADVSYYVTPRSKADEDAYRRGTSVYLVDRVLPMLPEELCNDKCSLKPGEDKLCMSVVFTIDAEARVQKYKICRTVIHSNNRLNYDEALEIMKGERGKVKGERGEVKGEELFDALTTLNSLAQKMRAERIANGALTIEQPEMRFRLDAHGHPKEIYLEESNEAHHLIEEFMLLANRTVAKAIGSGRPFIYRVHDLPNGERLDEIETFKKKLSSRRSSRYAGKSTEGLRRAIEMLTIRAQAKAVYSTHNIGHYGLAFSHYTHFTSPIRRYPDLMVHRLVDKYILTGKPATWTQPELEEICEHCSACEQEAAEAERDSIKLFQSIYMSDHIGEIVTGYISGITEFGLFVQLDESHCEGLIHISKIGDINRYQLGDAVTVKVVKTDINRALIDFEFA